MTPLPPRRHALISLAILVGAFAAVTAIAEAAGAANLGTAMSFGQLGFALALLYVLLRR
ncbi:MAG: hypothetical protein JWM73_2311 [Solirubrobacterales bacterium]|nr:hypothetical protein [Solirubrobacterales bacterium]